MKACAYVASCGQEGEGYEYVLLAFSAFIVEICVFALDLYDRIILFEHITSWGS